MGWTSLPPDHYAVFKNVTRFSWVDRDELTQQLGVAWRGKGAICSPEEFRLNVRDARLIRRSAEQAEYRDKVGPLRGIPQGSPISAVLANIYLDGFDKEVHAAVERLEGIYRRYADDLCWLVVLCTSGLEAAWARGCQ